VHETVRGIAQRCRPTPEAEDVAVYVIDLARPGALAQAWTLLNDGERKRAGALRLLSRRVQFVLCRAMIRLLLGEEIGCDPRRLCFAENRFGQPYLVCEEQSWTFSISHSRHIGLVAIRQGGHVGVDIQHARPGYPWQQLARHFCGQAEAQVAAREAHERGDIALLERWVAKEALLKAAGYGLAYPPTQIDLQRAARGWECTVAFAPVACARVVALDPVGGVPAALAVLD
jgi:4'-phosphopantetheinyl transferase